MNLTASQDRSIDRVVDRAAVELRAALRSMFETGATIHIFNLAEVNGKPFLTLFIARELPAIILESTAEGIGKFGKRSIEMMESGELPEYVKGVSG